MPVGKVRPTKRSLSSGYSSTVTTVIFVALCVLGVWMLSSDTVAPPKSTTRTTGTTSIHSSSIAEEDRESRDTEPAAKKKEPVFVDSQGDLPEDAIKAYNEAIRDGQKDESSEVSNDSVEVVGSSDTVTEVVSKSNDKQDNDKQDAGQQNGVSEGNGDGKPDAVQDIATEDKKVDIGKGAGISQISAESSVTQNQELEEIKENQSRDSGDNDSQQTRDDQHRSEKQNVEETKVHEDTGGTESQQTVDNHDRNENQMVEETEVHEDGPKEKNDQVISDEDQQKRLEQHQKQEDDQMQQRQPQKETQVATSRDNEASTSLTEKNEKVSIQDMDQKEKVSKPQSKEIDSFPAGEKSGIPKESKDSKKSWSTQADQSENQKERRKVGTEDQKSSIYGYEWQLCNVTAGADYIPCLDNEQAIAKLKSRMHYEHRERHCPEEAPTCLVQLPEGYKKPTEWPHSRDKIWYSNVPHTLLAEVKGHQNWVKVTGEFLTFPGGGTQFIHGALHYIDFIQEAVPDIAWGKHTRVILDVGCGVASFGGYLFERNVLAMSFAPKDEHEAQIQFALERGIPAISAVMGTQRLPFPSKVFDVVHCARCRVPWHVEGGALLLELNRLLRPGGYFVWSATPVYQKLEEDVQIWNEMSKLTVSMCWELVTIKKDRLNSIGAAVYRKPDSNECYDKRKQNRPPMCKSDDDPNASWYVPLQACMHRVPTEENVRGSEWPEEWPHRLQTPPYWLNRSQMGIYGKPAPEDFTADYEHWKHVVSKTYLSGLGISWSDVRNIMDMRAVYGGFAAALKDLKVWVMNAVNVDSPDTLPIIYERGLFGIYHDWCESFSTYPRTYDLLHADHLFSRLKKRCKLVPVLAEVDRITRPGGKLIVRDDSSTIEEVENLLKSLHWEVHMTFSKDHEGILSAQKSNWRPDSFAAPS